MSAAVAGRPDRRGKRNPDRRTVASGFLFGCGIAAAMIDLFVFHLVLQWHHFYDLSTTRVALTADGFFHAFAWFITVGGLFLLADVRRRSTVVWPRWIGAVVTGLGFFQLLDGVLNHKVLGVHQVRYGVDLLPYDVAWIGSAVLLLLIGMLILWRTRPDAAPGADPAAGTGTSTS
ncbi:putative membrane protein [Brachybacterium muris]|uniref:DUF2243 domain-containing protein n=1 Tax=Brachybacterium muris TaxID=219301 RepID=UPI00195DE6C1|nr:DUF2243 domain-containing protein [Brachybacterium muris]MBM7502047.1 putative membrane protein [Brachybacterium muris]